MVFYFKILFIKLYKEEEKKEEKDLIFYTYSIQSTKQNADIELIASNSNSSMFN